jgi:hypothetical protein
MALRETDPVRLAAFAHASFKRHHFENTMHLLDVVGTLEPDPEIRAAIGKGLTACR